jgi:hypothetical protein
VVAGIALGLAGAVVVVVLVVVAGYTAGCRSLHRHRGGRLSILFLMKLDRVDENRCRLIRLTDCSDLPLCFADADLADHDRGDYAQAEPTRAGFRPLRRRPRSTASGERRRPM